MSELDAIKKIYLELIYIDKADLTRAEKNILRIIGEWSNSRTGNQHVLDNAKMFA